MRKIIPNSRNGKVKKLKKAKEKYAIKTRKIKIIIKLVDKKKKGIESHKKVNILFLLKFYLKRKKSKC
jgi:hypothetical protein